MVEEILQGLRSDADTLLIAIDGTEYFSSRQIHCSNGSTRTLKSGETHYFHSVITPVIVAPGQAHVIPLVSEFIVPQDGRDKQDCENAVSRPDSTFNTNHILSDGNIADIVLAGRTR